MMILEHFSPIANTLVHMTKQSVDRNYSPPNRYLILDGFRGVAAFSVASLHIYFWQFRIFNGITFFVDFFFVLSGFVLGPSLLASRKISNFIISRLIRLYPAILVSFTIIGITYILPFLRVTSSAQKLVLWQYICAFLLLQVFIPNIYWINHPLWSLSAELLVNIWAILLPITKKYIYLYVSFGVALELLSYTKYNLSWNSTTNYSPIGRVLVGFYLGILIRIQLNEKRLSGSHTTYISTRRITLGIIFLVLNFLLIGLSYIFLIFAAPCFYFFVKEIIKFDQQKLSHEYEKVLSYLGKISYGVYVFHIPISRAITGEFLVRNLHFNLDKLYFLILGFLIKIFLTLLVATLSVKFVEVPLKKFIVNIRADSNG